MKKFKKTILAILLMAIFLSGICVPIYLVSSRDVEKAIQNNEYEDMIPHPDSFYFSTDGIFTVRFWLISSQQEEYSYATGSVKPWRKVKFKK